MSKYEVFSGPYFLAFGPEKTPYLDTFHAVKIGDAPLFLEYFHFHFLILLHVWFCLLENSLIVLMSLLLRSNLPKLFLGKGALKICSRFRGDTYAEVWFQYSCKKNRNACSIVNLLHVTLFPKNTSGGLLLIVYFEYVEKGRRCI